MVNFYKYCTKMFTRNPAGNRIFVRVKQYSHKKNCKHFRFFKFYELDFFLKFTSVFSIKLILLNI